MDVRTFSAPRIRPIALLSMLAVAPLAAGAQTAGAVALDFSPMHTTVGAAKTGLAPMDRSFGRYPMSVFGISQAIKRYYGTTQLDDGPIAYAIVAIRDWERNFPHDPWIAKSLLEMQHVYERSQTPEGEQYARATAAWLQADYPASSFAAESRNEYRDR